MSPAIPSRRSLVFHRLSLAAGLALGVSAWAADEPPAAEPVVELPKFVVTDSRELPLPESWRYATIPGFEILTNATDKATQRLLADFQMFRIGLSYVWPMPSKPGHPISLIISARGGKFDAFVPKNVDGTNAETARASVFLKQGEHTAIVIDFETSILNIIGDTTNDAATSTDSSQFSVDHNKQLYREYVRYLLSQGEPRLPAWFEEGMSQIIMKMKVEPKLIEFGKIEDPNLISAQAGMVAQINAATAADDPDSPTLGGAPAEDRDFNAALQRKALMSFPKFFAITHDSPEAASPLGNNVWAKQAYAWVHMCLYGQNEKFQKQFSTFLYRIMQGEPVTEEMFKKCFRFPKRDGTFTEMGYREMLLELKGYIDFTNYKSKEFRAAKGTDGIEKPPPLVLRDATQAEIGRIKGEALMLAGNKEKARTELIAPYIRGERDPQLLAALGLHLNANGEAERGRKLIEAAVAAKTTTPEAHLELAKLRYADAAAKPAGPEGKFSPAQVTGIVTPLIYARTQPPSLPGVYDLMAETWVRSPEKQKKDEIKFLIEGVQLFPGRLKLVYQTAVLAFDAGIIDVAHTLADHGIRYARDATTKGRFEALKGQLPPAPATPAPATPPAASPKK